MSPKDLLEFQPSLAEWFERVGQTERAHELRHEDNTRTERFRELLKVITIPCDVPMVVGAEALREKSGPVAEYFESFGQEPCAIRLVPKRSGLPKLRSRGLFLNDCFKSWFLEQKISDPDYDAEIYRHSNNHAWSTIFVVGEQGVTGEIIAGQHNQLTSGEMKTSPYHFWYNFTDLSFVPAAPPAAIDWVVKLLRFITIPEIAAREALQEKLKAKFYKNILGGYFEAVVWDTGEIFFIDYNRLLGDTIQGGIGADQGAIESRGSWRGSRAQGGVVRGIARVLKPEDLGTAIFNLGDVLVAFNTDVRFLPFMQKAGAIVTEQGGILSHAAIVAREYKKPCLVGVAGLLQAVKNGDTVEVDADRGIIKVL
ncbi:MAG: PEP-utilizing enzyme [Candidatus Magasanikbacteria bacterium]|nr:PEP-utilizing enzyme [Candidatus Magasanikbacteria bacterium]